MTIGQRILAAREEAGLSQRQTAGEHMTRNMLSCLEHDKAKPSLDTLLYLSRTLGKSVGYFLGEDQVPVEGYPAMVQARRAYEDGEYRACLTALSRIPAGEVLDRERTLLELLAKAEVGDIIPFGLFPENKSSDSKPLQWRVLKKEGTRLLVITEYCIDKIPYHRDLLPIQWENCDLRWWFNVPFFQLTFTPEEQAMIPAVPVSNGPNPRYRTAGCADTADHVFALSLEEAGALFAADEARLGYTTLYAQSRGYYFGGKINCWWLRGPGVSPEFAALVGNSGSLGTYGYRVDQNEYAVRPAMWIDFGG